MFKPLDFDQVVVIARLELRKVATMLGQKGITLEASDAAIEDLAKRGFDPKIWRSAIAAFDSGSSG